MLSNLLTRHRDCLRNAVPTLDNEGTSEKIKHFGATDDFSSAIESDLNPQDLHLKRNGLHIRKQQLKLRINMIFEHFWCQLCVHPER